MKEEQIYLVSQEELEEEDQEAFTISYRSNYKLDGNFAVKPSQEFAITMVLEIGSGPNFVATRELPTGWVESPLKIEIVR